MIPLANLWLPILLSAVAVLIVSNILWMALPFWHRADYGRLENEKALLDAVSSAKSGQYLAPYVNWSKLPPEEREAMGRRAMALTLVRNPAKFNFVGALIAWFVYLLVISLFIGYVGAVTLPRGSGNVFRVITTVGILAWAFASVSDSIWYGKPWSVTAKVIVDGVIYGLITGAIFCWLWPH